MLTRKSIVSTLITTLAYGVIASSLYLRISTLGKSSVFLALTQFLWISLLIIAPFATIRGIIKELSFPNIFRPFVFATSQLLFMYAASSSAIYSTFFASAIGSISAVVFGKIMIGEKPSRVGVLGLLIIFIGIGMINSSLGSFSIIACIAGALQGLGAAYTRRLTLKGSKPPDIAFSGLLLLVIMAAVYSFIIRGDSGVIQTSYIDLLVLGALAGVLQLSYCFLAKKYEGWVVSAITNGRMPVSVVVEWLLSAGFISYRKIFSAFMILCGISILHYKTVDDRRSLIITTNVE